MPSWQELNHVRDLVAYYSRVLTLGSAELS